MICCWYSILLLVAIIIALLLLLVGLLMVHCLSLLSKESFSTRIPILRRSALMRLIRRLRLFGAWGHNLLLLVLIFKLSWAILVSKSSNSVIVPFQRGGILLSMKISIAFPTTSFSTTSLV